MIKGEEFFDIPHIDRIIPWNATIYIEQSVTVYFSGDTHICPHTPMGSCRVNTNFDLSFTSIVWEQGSCKWKKRYKYQLCLPFHVFYRRSQLEINGSVMYQYLH